MLPIAKVWGTLVRCCGLVSFRGKSPLQPGTSPPVPLPSTRGSISAGHPWQLFAGTQRNHASRASERECASLRVLAPSPDRQEALFGSGCLTPQLPVSLSRPLKAAWHRYLPLFGNPFTSIFSFRPPSLPPVFFLF